MDKQLGILFLATELKGVLSVGGLGEVVASLAYALKKLQHDVCIAMPVYECMQEIINFREIEPVWKGKLNLGDLPDAVIYRVLVSYQDQQFPVYFIKGHPWFEKVMHCDQIYAPESNPEPYFFLSAALIRFLQDTSDSWCPDIIHCHDYHAAPLSVYLKTMFHNRINRKHITTIFTIHNLEFQGITSPELLTHVGLSESLASYSEGLDSMEYYGKINCMKGGLCYSDLISTVSQTYAEEIQTPSSGYGLDGVLSVLSKDGRLQGILNGINQDEWDPRTLEEHLAYSVQNLGKKQNAKQLLRATFGLEETEDPVIAVRSRWTHQKGIELLLYAFRHYQLYKNAQFIIFTNTTPFKHISKYWYEIKRWATEHPRRIVFYHAHTQNRILQNAGSDMLLMPSLYEPCGITQMEAMRFGTIPIVHKTGGLADSVSFPHGFCFDWKFKEPLNRKQKLEGTSRMVNTVYKAIEAFHDKFTWFLYMRQAMSQRNDWMDRVNSYCQLYENASRLTQEKIVAMN